MNISRLVLLCALVMPSFSLAADDESVPEYNKDIAPVFKKYCAGCHNDDDKEGEFSLETFAALRKGTEDGPAFLPGDAASSKMYRLLQGTEPAMPPEDEPRPSAEQIELVRRWIDSGGKGPAGAELDRMTLIVPTVESHSDTRPITAIDVSPDGLWRAVARHIEVTIEPVSGSDDGQVRRLQGPFVGPVTAVHYVGDDRLLTASGVVGLGGVAALWNVADGTLIREFKGHRDTLYDAELSPDGLTLATCSYDKQIILWDAESGESLRTLSGHNGAVYDVAFSPDGKSLVSASADDTCKVWRVSDGVRLDTLGQPLKEAYCCAFSPDGNFILAGGADNRIRVWRFVSRSKPRINPAVMARFAHEGAVLRMAFTPDGKKLVSIADDQTVKVWETRNYTELKLWESQPDVAAALAVSPDGLRFTVGRMDGSIESFKMPERTTNSTGDSKGPSLAAAATNTVSTGDLGTMNETQESEPNDVPAQATTLALPARVTGVIHTAPLAKSEKGDASESDQTKTSKKPDVDLYRFVSKAGQAWVIETNASQSKSPVDTFIEVLDSEGNRIERVLLQSVRDSYFTFRGKSADQTNDFRLFNWNEMSLNQYLYANGEVVRLWMHPRGPDSGFNVYPGEGTRWAYFDTTPLSHALGEPAYIVKPHPPGAELIPNGLPTFTLYSENDDASTRDLGKDSRVYFTAPADGAYFVKVKDVRGMQGADYKYTLSVRPPQPDFRMTAKFTQEKNAVAPGSHQEFVVKAKRMDGYDGPIRVDVGGTLPPGFSVTSPVTIEAGQVEAYGIISAAADAKPPTEENAKGTTLTASATIDGNKVAHTEGTLGEIKLAEKIELKVTITATERGPKPVHSGADEPLAFAIHPGETILLKVSVERMGFEGAVSFGKEYSGRNLPHGCYISNIGLNGLLLLKRQTEREFSITCDETTRAPQSRWFHIETKSNGGHTSQRVMLHVIADSKVTVD